MYMSKTKKTIIVFIGYGLLGLLLASIGVVLTGLMITYFKYFMAGFVVWWIGVGIFHGVKIWWKQSRLWVNKNWSKE